MSDRRSLLNGVDDDDNEADLELQAKPEPPHRFVAAWRMLRSRQCRPWWLLPAVALETNAVLWAAYGVTRLFENPFCNLMFACGCRFDALGGWRDCNVHNPSGPRCPFCAASALVNWMSFCVPPMVQLAAYVAISLKLHKRPWWQQLIAQVGATVVAWILTELLLGLAFFLATPSYAYFLGFGPTPGHRWSWVPPPDDL